MWMPSNCEALKAGKIFPGWCLLWEFISVFSPIACPLDIPQLSYGGRLFFPLLVHPCFYPSAMSFIRKLKGRDIDFSYETIFHMIDRAKLLSLTYCFVCECRWSLFSDRNWNQLLSKAMAKWKSHDLNSAYNFISAFPGSGIISKKLMFIYIHWWEGITRE